jgi:hypothetical protein
MSYIGSTPTTQSFISGTDYFNGTGSQTAFTLSRTVASVNDVEAVVNNVVQRPNDAYNISGTTITFTSAPSAGTSNIYVRYLSTTTQSITPSQNTVSYASWNSDLQSETFAFKNRIINGAMMIDQRNAGASVTVVSTGSATYSVDRWFGYGSQASKFTIQQNAGSVTPPTGYTNYVGVTSSASTSLGASDQFLLGQYIEGFNCADLGWGASGASTVTLSFWVRSSLTGTFGGVLTNDGYNRSYPFSYTISAANTWEQKSITITGDTTGTWLKTNGTGIRVIYGLGVGSTLSGTAGSWSGSTYVSATGATSVVGTSGATFYITGVQLEKGSTATSFDYRPYGTELMLCQRYYQRTSFNVGNSPAISAFANGTYYLATQVYLVYPLRVSMRSAPSGSSSGNGALEIFANGGSRVSTSVVVQGQTPDQVELNITTTSSLAGAGAWARFSGSSDWVAFSAEL